MLQFKTKYKARVTFLIHANEPGWFRQLVPFKK